MGPFVRPSVAELVFRLYDRPLHPELFDALAVRRVERNDYRLAVHITPAGHILSWTHGSVHVVEVTATADQELPSHGRRLGHPFRGERCGRCDVVPGVRYQVSSQVEVLPPEQFLHVHEELVSDGARKGMLFHFRPENRFGLSPLGVVIVEALPACLSVSAFHTFPDEFALIKTQSLIERV
ncbi:MAG TPA: DUF2617 family protein [Gemmataceae bacterium]|jgi:hypothetical protein|nr:DUF2617 family protein [Gemmataceae bacterium]